MGDSAIDVAAWALFDMHGDLSDCPYYQKSGDKLCAYGCSDEPRCQTCTPSGGWPLAALREKYAHILAPGDEWGEPVNEDFLTALTMLHGLHEAGWRVVRTDEHEFPDEDVVHVVEEWEP